MGLQPSGLTEELVKKYSLTGPYYTSYPPVSRWTTDVDSSKFVGALDEFLEEDENVPLSLYLHFPFCPELCSYCHCYVVITENQFTMKHFLDHLLLEIDLLRDYFEKKGIQPNIREIHLGGGSPNTMEEGEFSRLVDKLQTLVDIKSLNEFAIEIDVRSVDRDKVQLFQEKGINRVSFGIQDFNPEVQKAVNRVQPVELVERLLTPDLRKNFKSINFDIMWGLPLQTRETFRETIEIAKELSPDRVTLLHYGHFPDVYKHQKLISGANIANEYEKIVFNVEAIASLEEGGYERIGLDHFALMSDELSQLKKEKALRRSFIGYPGRAPDLIALGPSGLGGFSNFYFQNIYGLPEYCKGISEGVFTVFRGYKLDSDLLIRRDVINGILNYFVLRFEDIEKKYRINFEDYFKEELRLLGRLVDDGLAEVSNNAIQVTSLGRCFVRHVCMVFDKYWIEEHKHKPTSRKDSRAVHLQTKC
jgi:oxygen-independent coproporphyrinogen-3 oxidase